MSETNSLVGLSGEGGCLAFHRGDLVANWELFADPSERKKWVLKVQVGLPFM